MTVADDVLAALRTWGRQPAGELVTRLGISRPTLMRAVRALGAEAISLGSARRTTYAARRAIRGNVEPLPVYQVDTAAQVDEVATLYPTHPAGTAVQFLKELGWPLDKEMAQGWFDGVPYMFDDMRPQGFLGRHFARAYADVLQAPEDPTKWSDDDVLYALALRGADQPGCYIIGQPALRSWLAQPRGLEVDAIVDDRLNASYLLLAESAMAQGIFASSAGGEFPKFTALRNVQGEHKHVLVKFSGSDESPGTHRWSDLLVCEHLAGLAIRKHLNMPSAHSEILQAGGRTFLEVVRFDRHGARGRSPMCSWAALNADLVGLGPKNWGAAAQALAKGGWIDVTTRLQIERLWHFGRLIANSDMHEGNLAFLPGLKLTPAYDMLPMLYAPERGVELPVREFNPPAPIPSEREAWHLAKPAAIAFWELAAADLRISEGFRQICEANAQRVTSTG